MAESIQKSADNILPNLTNNELIKHSFYVSEEPVVGEMALRMTALLDEIDDLKDKISRIEPMYNAMFKRNQELSQAAGQSAAMLKNTMTRMNREMAAMVDKLGRL